MTATATTPRRWPEDITASRQDKTLTITFNTGETFTLTAEFLRVNSPSAEVQGHSPAERQTVGGKRSVGIIDVEPVGNYAIKITFDDLHDSGIYSWDTLFSFGRDHDVLWQEYLDELAEKKLSRDKA